MSALQSGLVDLGALTQKLCLHSVLLTITCVTPHNLSQARLVTGRQLEKAYELKFEFDSRKLLQQNWF